MDWSIDWLLYLTDGGTISQMHYGAYCSLRSPWLGSYAFEESPVNFGSYKNTIELIVYEKAQ